MQADDFYGPAFNPDAVANDAPGGARITEAIPSQAGNFDPLKIIDGVARGVDSVAKSAAAVFGSIANVGNARAVQSFESQLLNTRGQVAVAQAEAELARARASISAPRIGGYDMTMLALAAAGVFLAWSSIRK
jgi:hypothetical protein